MKSRTLLFLACVVVASHTVLAQSSLRNLAQSSLRGDDSATVKVDQMFAEWDKTISPGCALGIIEDGEMTYQRGYGMANLDYGIPISTSSVFYIGSVSKQFAAASVALLAAQDKLSLDDDIRQYLQEIPDYGTPINIRHLIHHVSGLRDFWTLVALAGLPTDNVYTDEDVLEVASRQKSLNFTPGEEYLYSNTNYLLLAMIVKRVSGQSLREYADANLFAPLGMDRTIFNDDHTRIVKNRVSGYAPRQGGGFQLSMVNNDLVGQGGLWTTVEDLAHWDQNFYLADVGGSAFIEQLLTRGTLTNGEELDYAFGLNVTEHEGKRMVTHGGAMGGYRAVLTRFPDDRFSVALLCNLSTTSPSRLALRIADLYLFGKDPSEGSPPSPTTNAGAGAAEELEPFALTEEERSAYAGDYFSDELRATYRIAVKDGGLYFTHRNALTAALEPTERDAFRSGPATLRFEHDPGGRISGFLLDAGRVRNLRFVRQ